LPTNDSITALRRSSQRACSNEKCHTRRNHRDAIWQLLRGGSAIAVRDGIASVTAGFVVSYMVMGLGWALLAIALLRAKLIGGSGWFLVLASLIAISPAPFRYVPLTIAVTFACGLRLGRRKA
jgi:hypothetical protein